MSGSAPSIFTPFPGANKRRQASHLPRQLHIFNSSRQNVTDVAVKQLETNRASVVKSFAPHSVKIIPKSKKSVEETFSPKMKKNLKCLDFFVFVGANGCRLWTRNWVHRCVLSTSASAVAAGAWAAFYLYCSLIESPLGWNGPLCIFLKHSTANIKCPIR